MVTAALEGGPVQERATWCDEEQNQIAMSWVHSAPGQIWHVMPAGQVITEGFQPLQNIIYH